MRSKIKVTAPAQGDVEVTVYRSNGSTAATAYTTETGSSTVSWALTVDAGETETVWVPVGAYVVSVKTTDDVEFADGYGNTRSVFVDNDGVDLRPQPVPGVFGGSGGGGSGDLLAANNLDDLDDVATARTNLGLGSAAVLAANELRAQAQQVNAQTGTTYALVASDAGKLVTLSNASAVSLSVPQDSDATIAVGTYVDLMQLGVGQVTVVAGTGATLRVSGLTAKARAQYSRLGVQKISADTWSLFGDLAVN